VSCAVGSVLDPEVSSDRGSRRDRVGMVRLLSPAHPSEFHTIRLSVTDVFQDGFSFADSRGHR
jgi:hypothetical protein